jgi:aspartyl-tRNA(Asn)/glutamyl-tRNA(Gln) amidotransferase subunit A
MNLQHWLAAAIADARQRDLPALEPLLSALAEATTALRSVDWEQSGAPAPDGPARPDSTGSSPVIGIPPPGEPVSLPAPHHQPISVVAPQLRSRSLSVSELVAACLEEIARKDGSLNAFITVFATEARAQAQQADEEIAAGRYRGPLHGMPISLKDLIDLRGIPTTAGSRVRAGHRAAVDAPLAAALRRAGAIFIGKCNLHEFAFGTTSDESAFGPVRNPHDPARSPGGSSGGSAAGVVAGMSMASVGTDTGGSVRIPAAACGIVGFKPTFGEISCDGVVPLARSLDHVGPLTRSVADARLLYRTMQGQDFGETSWAGRSRRLRLGLPRAYFLERLDPEVRLRFEEALRELDRCGAAIDEVAVPQAASVAPVYLHIVLAEASAYHAATLSSRPSDYQPGIRLRLEMGRVVLGEDYVRAARAREVLRAEVDAALDGRDALVLPTLAIPAPPIGASKLDAGHGPEPIRNLTLRLTQLFNLTGHPAISLPCGSTSTGLPCGLQLVAGRHRDEELLGVAATCEAILMSAGQRPDAHAAGPSFDGRGATPS